MCTLLYTLLLYILLVFTLILLYYIADVEVHTLSAHQTNHVKISEELKSASDLRPSTPPGKDALYVSFYLSP